MTPEPTSPPASTAAPQPSGDARYHAPIPAPRKLTGAAAAAALRRQTEIACKGDA